MRIVILSRKRHYYSTRRLREAALARGHEVILADPFRCVLLIDGRPRMFLGRREVLGVDAVIPRIGLFGIDFILSVLRQFAAMRVLVMNGPEAVAAAKDKVGSLQRLAVAGVPVPPTAVTRSGANVGLMLRMVQGTPLILKLPRGTQGAGVALAETPRAAASVMEALLALGQDVLLQHCVTESFGRDVRALVVNGRVVAAMRRIAPDGEFRSNIHRGAVGLPVALSDVERRVTVSAARVLGLRVAGVDFLQTRGGPVVLEVNASPGFRGLEMATGRDIAKILVDETVAMVREGRRQIRAV